jgi:hypothetical protein
MRSVRFDPEFDDRMRRAAAARGESVSQFIRSAVEEHTEQTLRGNATDRLADVIGVVHGGGGRARRTGEAVLADLGGPRTRKPTR